MNALIDTQDKAATAHSIVVGGQRISMRVLLELQRDAARYRWLRDKADAMTGTAAPMVASLDEKGRMVTLIDGEELDTAVDMAMARTASHRGRRSKAARNKTEKEEENAN